MNLEAIVADNRAILNRMRSLNVRAGNDEFPLPTQEDLRSHFAAALQGARCIAEITNFDALRLPQLDEAVVDSILAKCPDTINVLGLILPVKYCDQYGNPVESSVRIPDNTIDWRQLPDEGIKLPGGRAVSVQIWFGYGDFVTNFHIPTLKRGMCERLNREQWVQWRQPHLPLPTDSIPPITEQEYGRCALTDDPLVAFGTLKYESWNESWESYWSRDRTEVERVRERSCQYFLKLRKGLPAKLSNSR